MIEIPVSIKDAIEYRPETGEFVWKTKAHSRAVIGGTAGSRSKKGYWRIKHKGRVLEGHRVAWFLMTGEQPPEMVDHKDTDPTNNRWSNLRASNAQHNPTNRAKSLCGVFMQDGKWRAGIRRNTKQIWLYYGPDFFEACCRRKSAEL